MARVRIGGVELASFRGEDLQHTVLEADRSAWEASAAAVLRSAGYPAKAAGAGVDRVAVLAILVLFNLFAALVYGPLAAMLVELFPTRIRYTALSLPYHIGNGWFGGLLPPAAFAMTAATGNPYFGLWYPVAIAGLTLAACGIFIRETRGADIS